MQTGTDDLANRRKRLRFRSWHRGLKEVDLILGRFADLHLDELDAGQLDRYEVLLEISDIELYAWYAGTREPPEDLRTDVWAMVKAFPVHEASA